ncbi:MAG: SDR family NAD(P)-dependent oxidoreductase [Pseudomonadales bacterium]
MNILDGKVAIVTGAGKPDGIGFATCIKLAEAGAKVVITDLVANDEQQALLDARVVDIKALGADAAGCALDVTKLADAQRAAELAVETFGGIDILFNNAGWIGGLGPCLEQTDQQFTLSWQINVMGTLNMCRVVIPLMQQRGGGSIINNSSVAGISVVPNEGAYTASKHAVVALSKTLAIEHGADKIRVNTVCPGSIMTSAIKDYLETVRKEGESDEEVYRRLTPEVPMQRAGDPSEIGDAVVFLGSDQSNYVTGIVFPVHGGMASGL